MNKQRLNFLLTALAIGTLMIFYFFNPSDFAFFPACYFKMFTGFDCPGCGGQRALHDLLHLRFSKAINHNLLFVAGSPVLGFVAFNALFAKEKRYFTTKTIWLFCLVVLSFWVVRNIPASELIWLRAD